MAEVFGALGIFGFLFLIVFGLLMLVMSILLPFFVYGIWARMKQQNRDMQRLINALSGRVDTSTRRKELGHVPPKLMECTHCSHRAVEVDFASADGLKCPACGGV